MSLKVKNIVKEMLLSLIDFPDYMKGSCEEDFQKYSVTEDEKETFCSDMAEIILQGKIECLDDIQEKADCFAEECFMENKNIFNEAMEDVYRK